ncbi:disease resistance protein RPV1-like [Vicia villosa]|uniref:disease resistance protein RPV1-like n=1 Tax=Vicia villosa TaxID=3911 RepID=UPI00273ADEF7|nr:disease resistance protein RPV1-like [Vicia villosa]
MSSPTSSFSDEETSSRRRRKYDVFLSFRGKDTRASFTSHLYASLQNAGFIVFMDDQSLQRGKFISTSLLQGIKDSSIAVVVFSKNYAGSQWCMRELVEIMEYRCEAVLPVFYHVDPSEVRNQTGDVGKVFRNLLNNHDENEYEAIDWKNALVKLGRIAGFVVSNYRNEGEDIKDIVEKVTHLLDKTDLFVADHPVGVESRVLDMIQLLDTPFSNDVLLLGMWGMGGIGKTTIAKPIYNKVGHNFEARCFLANIREVWEQDFGPMYLQERILYDIFKETTTKIQNIESGKSALRERLCNKRILLVLDDVNKLDQLKALCGSRKWFGPGSRIIVTTRDKQIIRGNRVNQVYIMKEMDESESIELFSWHAFKKVSPRENFAEISRNVVKYCGGLPLALEVLGSYLFDRGVTEWECVLEKLKRIPNDQVHKKLKISYDGLNDDTERDIFLDIAFFFIGMDKNDVMHILNGCGLFAEIGISVLVERSLVRVDGKNKLEMHDLIRDMGREIIREISPKKLEKRSRLWFHEDVVDVWSEQTGTQAVEGLVLKLTPNAKCFSTKSFENMKKLRLLQLAGVQLDGDFQYLSRNLRWLCWNGFPFTCIPRNFYQRNLVSIELENSNIKFLKKEMQGLENLKILNLSHSHYLTETPDFSNMPNLEKLILKDCPRLPEVSDTIGHLHKVLLINLKDYISLSNLPRTIYTLKSLKTLILSGCLMIDKLEEDLEQMESLSTLIAHNTAITKVPFSIARSKNIGYISLCGYKGYSREVIPSIIRSWMSPTNNLSSLLQTPASMSSLVSLDASRSSSHSLSSISEVLTKVLSLLVECGSELQLSRDAILDALSATNSKESESSATTSQVSAVKTSTLIECCGQVHISTTKKSTKSLLIRMGTNCQTTNILKESILQNMAVNACGGCFLPGDSYPDWLTFNSEGSSVIFIVPQVKGRNLKTMMCFVYSSSSDNITSDGLKNVLVINHTKTTIQLYKREAFATFENEEWQRVVSNMEPGDKMEIVVVFDNGFIVTKTTIYLIYDKSIGKQMERCCALDKDVLVGSGDENECAAKTVSLLVEPTDDFKQKHKRRKLN